MLDILIQNGRAYTAEGRLERLNIGVKGARLAYIGRGAPAAAESLNARGLVVSPGFIDAHCHYDFAPFTCPAFSEKLYQGVTTMVAGPCGYSAFPVTEENRDILHRYVGFMRCGYEGEYPFPTFEAYASAVRRKPIAVNMAFLAGHGTLRIACMGMSAEKPDPAQMRRMQDMLREALEHGACGLSAGLIYPPGLYADTGELVALGEVLQEFHRPFAFHIRGESGTLTEAVREVLEIAAALRVPCQIHHHKAIGRENWGRTRETLRMIDEARSSGLDITLDQYPYLSGSSTLRALLPPWAQEGGVERTIERLNDRALSARIRAEILGGREGQNLYRECGPENIILLHAPGTPELLRKSLTEIGEALGLDPVEAAFRVICENGGVDKAACIFGCEEDVERVMKKTYTMLGSDSNPVLGGGFPHPRTFGAVNRLLGRYVRERGVITLEEALYKLTRLPAERFSLPGKGRLAVGWDADLTLFDPERICDRSDLSAPTALPVGVEHVLLGGKWLMRGGNPTGGRNGRPVLVRTPCSGDKL